MTDTAALPPAPDRPITYAEQLLSACSAWIGHVADVEWTDPDGDRVGFTGKILDVRLDERDGQAPELQLDAAGDAGATLRYTIRVFAEQIVEIRAWPGVPYTAPLPTLVSDEANVDGGLTDATAEDFKAPTQSDQPIIPAWYVTEIPQDFTPASPDDPWATEPLWQYVSGTAGTGKTFAQKLRADVDPRVKLTATTGIAAINLGGQTINSLLHYKDTPELSTQFELGRLNGTLSKLASSGFTRLIIDEISMMDGRQLDVLCEALDATNERLRKENEPLMGITLVGDFCQLPPVKAPFVFERPSWGRFQEAVVKLTEPRRQADPDFIHALQAVRRADIKLAVDYFADRIKTTIDGEFPGSTIMAKNDEVDRHNALRLMELPGKDVIFKAYRGGVQASEWKHIPDTNKMKIGALVMVLSNLREKGQYFRGEEDLSVERRMIYANGDLGILEDTQEYEDEDGRPEAVAHVRLHRNGQVVAVSTVEREYKEATGAKGEKKEREIKSGWIRFMPLRVAYATTAHKSQGLSLDRVQVVMQNAFFGHPGMLYVALSRARTPDGLRLVGTGPSQLRNRIKVDPKVLPWL